MNRSQYSLIEQTTEQGRGSQEPRRWRSFRHILRRTVSSWTVSRTTAESRTSPNPSSSASRPPSLSSTTPAASTDTLVEKAEAPYATTSYPFAHMDPVLYGAIHVVACQRDGFSSGVATPLRRHTDGTSLQE
ncbi:hypothetical protein TRAPUB_8342 [Trametes pubescens]|uniref:Uncharacterized protein n=1 Tax=Trametes pubescens TaxID=154538 RepID=A0A1M2W5F1_TRAPU|nr:hypothetical protein TRAPUB_8342 [Trametes pubescens]